MGKHYSKELKNGTVQNDINHKRGRPKEMVILKPINGLAIRKLTNQRKTKN